MAAGATILFYQGLESGIVTLASGEPGWATDSHKFFVGDGSTNHEIGGGSVSDGDKGDVTVSSSGTVWTIDSDVVTYAKIQNVSAASKLLGRGDSGSGDPQEITLGAGLGMSGTTLSVSGSSAAGSSTQVQYNSSGTLAGADRVLFTGSVFQVRDSGLSNVALEAGDTGGGGYVALAPSVGAKIGAFGSPPVSQQSGSAQTATGTWGSTEQAMLQAAYDCLRAFGFMA